MRNAMAVYFADASFQAGLSRSPRGDRAAVQTHGMVVAGYPVLVISDGQFIYKGVATASAPHFTPRHNLDSIKHRDQTGMDPVLSPSINDALPNDILTVIFEEHAKLEWNAPAVDGRVCRLWREIVLITPRAWSYLHISRCKRGQLSVARLREWLDRSRATPLHIIIDKDFRFDAGVDKQTLYDLLGSCRARVASLRMGSCDASLFFQGQAFPCLALLDLESWDQVAVPSTFTMPALRSLRVGRTGLFVFPLNDLPLLEVLALCDIFCPSISLHFPSLTTLMLDDVSFEDTLSGPVDFPQLTFLSLYDVAGLKCYINAPNLVTYHEGGFYSISESFSAPLPSLVEYGLFDPLSGSRAKTWHQYFPNVSRISIRAGPRTLVSLLDSLSDSPLSGLQTISVGLRGGSAFGEDEKEFMGKALSKRILHLLLFEKPSRQIPLFFADVSPRPIR